MTDDWFDILVALLDAGARFLVVGAHAMAAHGIPRGTQDLDIWVDPTPTNAQHVWQAMAAFGAPLLSIGVTAADFTKPERVVQIGLPPNRIDVLTGISGVAHFEDAWASRTVVEVRGRQVPVLGRSALIANKRAAGRPKDLADLHALGERP
jgi:hypothetical protein